MQIIIRRIDLHLKFTFNFIQFSMSPLHAVCTRNTKWKHRVFETVSFRSRRFLSATYSSEVNPLIAALQIDVATGLQRMVLVDRDEDLGCISTRGHLLRYSALFFCFRRFSIYLCTPALVVPFYN